MQVAWALSIPVVRPGGWIIHPPSHHRFSNGRANKTCAEVIEVAPRCPNGRTCSRTNLEWIVGAKTPYIVRSRVANGLAAASYRSARYECLVGRYFRLKKPPLKPAGVPNQSEF
jgi:hypothetical protein